MAFRAFRGSGRTVPTGRERLARWHRARQREAQEARDQRDANNAQRATCKCGWAITPTLLRCSWKKKPSPLCGRCLLEANI